MINKKYSLYRKAKKKCMAFGIFLVAMLNKVKNF